MLLILHNKIKNIRVLFELLTRQITADTINGVQKSPAIAIVKEYFNKNTYLTKELPEQLLLKLNKELISNLLRI